MIVWEHKAIQVLVSALGVEGAPQRVDADFDSIWIIDYQIGKAKLSMDKEGIIPSAECNY